MSKKNKECDYTTKLFGIVKLYELNLISKDEYFSLIRVINKEYGFNNIMAYNVPK